MVSKTWAFTLNNYTSEDEKLLVDLDKRYLVYGREVGESGTPHLQGWITFKNAHRLPALKKILPTAHWEIGKSTEGMNYCMKSKDYYLEDNRAQGSRTDIHAAVDTLKQKGLKEMVKEHPVEFVKYHTGFEKLNYYLQEDRDFIPYVEWIYGPTGVGKTQGVINKEKGKLWISNKDLNWWGNYLNEEAVLIDDFRGDFCKFHELLRILDGTPYDVAVKGGFRKLNSKRMYITSCYHPSQVYDTREDIEQLLRRITKITHLDGLPRPPMDNSFLKIISVISKNGVQEEISQEVPSDCEEEELS